MNLKTNNRIITLVSLLLNAGIALSQPAYDYDLLSTERLDRGVVAVRQADGRVFVSWRSLREDEPSQLFDIYRNDRKIHTTKGNDATLFIDEEPLSEDAVYRVLPLFPLPMPPAGGVKIPTPPPGGEFTLQADAPVGYISLPLQKPEGGTTPDGRPYSYTANDASVADVDGDGQYEIILKWDPTNSRDNAHDGYTGKTIFDCYRINGERLWRIDLGRNIRSGAHYVPFIVYDLDGDGRAELMVKTADGTRDALGRVIGDSLADYRNAAGRILDGPEYITVFSGLTGRALDTKSYVPARGNVDDWGDNRGNRSERYLAAVGYLGGGRSEEKGARLPSAVFCRGYYTRSVLTVWDWDGLELKQRWVFDTNDVRWKDYAGQGNHNLRVCDVDGDGFDEIIYGAMCVDHDGTGLYNTHMGHGDAIHLVALPSPLLKQGGDGGGSLLIWDCHENKRDGSSLRDARTGEIVFQIKSTSDVGRCLAADIDPTSPGPELWSSDSHGIRTLTGSVLGSAQDANDPQHDNHLRMQGRQVSINFAIWWDGDLLRELLDRATVSKYDWEQKTVVDIQRLEGAQFNNGTKSNPCLQADILGDWREEIITRSRESTELRIYVSTIPTTYRINCLMQDIPYRLSVAYQNVGYNQPPEPGFYLGPDDRDIDRK